ncbi:MAG: helix-turn-helix domain-containing protein [Propionibacteriaceae bacterium]|jgi:transcriptional regulator with XRE-family HTH domain|nr:helix-turn-helix domain-containing protein [Propionibacteriaceae bacterium]
MIYELRERPELFREAVGQVLRESRLRRKLTLREVSSKALVSLGYLSEVERGRKEASSEMLASICEANQISLSQMLHSAADRLDTDCDYTAQAA